MTAKNKPTAQKNVPGLLLQKNDRSQNNINMLFRVADRIHNYKTRASRCSFSTSLAAASLGGPSRNSVFFVFTGA